MGTSESHSLHPEGLSMRTLSKELIHVGYLVTHFTGEGFHKYQAE